MKKTIIILCLIAVTLLGGMFIKNLHTESKKTVYKERTQTTEVVEKQQPTSEKEKIVEEKIDTSKEEIEKTTEVTKKHIKKWQTFKTNLLEGIAYYNATFEQTTFFESDKNVLQDELCYFEQQIAHIEIPTESN